MACVSDDVLPKGDVFNLAAMPEGVYINVVPFFNAGNVHKWVSRALAPSEQGKYDYVDRLLEESEAGSHGTMFLPYLVGERFPVVDTQIRGGYVGVTPETTKQDLARSALEGVAFSIRQGIESIGRVPGKISLIGGGRPHPRLVPDPRGRAGASRTRLPELRLPARGRHRGVGAGRAGGDRGLHRIHRHPAGLGQLRALRPGPRKRRAV